MAKAIQAFINDNDEPVQPGDEVWATPERLAVLRRLGLVDDSPSLLPWQRPRPATETAPAKLKPRLTMRKGSPGSGRAFVISML